MRKHKLTKKNIIINRYNFFPKNIKSEFLIQNKMLCFVIDFGGIILNRRQILGCREGTRDDEGKQRQEDKEGEEGRDRRS